MGLDAQPGNLGLLDSVEQFGRMGRFCRQSDEAGQIRREGGNIPRFPARSQDIVATGPDDQYRANHSDDFVNRLECVFPEIGQNHFLFIISQIIFIALVLHGFFAVDAVCHGIADAVQCHS